MSILSMYLLSTVDDTVYMLVLMFVGCARNLGTKLAVSSSSLGTSKVQILFFGYFLFALFNFGMS